MLTVDSLRARGVNVEEGLKRCMGMESFYLKLVNKALDGRETDDLAAALEKGDLDAAFEKAHALKGVAGNLALTPMYAPAAELTELLRSRTETDYSELLGRLVAAREELLRLREE